MPCRPKFLPRLLSTTVFGRMTASGPTDGYCSASEKSMKDSSITTRSRSPSWSMNRITSRRARKLPSGWVTLENTATREPPSHVAAPVEPEAVPLQQRVHLDPLAGLHRLVGPPAQGGDRDRHALLHQQV